MHYHALELMFLCCFCELLPAAKINVCLVLTKCIALPAAVKSGAAPSGIAAGTLGAAIMSVVMILAASM